MQDKKGKRRNLVRSVSTTCLRASSILTNVKGKEPEALGACASDERLEPRTVREGYPVRGRVGRSSDHHVSSSGRVVDTNSSGKIKGIARTRKSDPLQCKVVHHRSSDHIASLSYFVIDAGCPSEKKQRRRMEPLKRGAVRHKSYDGVSRGHCVNCNIKKGPKQDEDIENELNELEAMANLLQKIDNPDHVLSRHMKPSKSKLTTSAA